MTAILIYHDVVAPEHRDTSGFPGKVAGRYKHDPVAFGEHLDALAVRGGIGVVRADEPRPRVALTFDDGGSSALEIADALERRDMCGHFFITTARVGSAGFLDADGVRELHARGHVVGSHSHTHPRYMGRLPEDVLRHEWRESRERLAEILGAPPESAAIPGGFSSPALLRAADAAGYAILMTSEPSLRPRSVGGLEVLGRYTIWGNTRPATAAAYARGALPARTRLFVSWRVKSVAKRLGPETYQALRRARAGGA
jgi:peptidoglycan/xylan/chitin deacetylase (PgdA/CDA1 family)